ncbi:hypothetical protein MMC10_002466 [Thelotrema lepadinum]|nr:hypothetical protein [Thelotrema lepadinum]
MSDKEPHTEPQSTTGGGTHPYKTPANSDEASTAPSQSLGFDPKNQPDFMYHKPGTGAPGIVGAVENLASG